SRAPALSRAETHAEAVAPVVRTSSTSQIPQPCLAGGIRAWNISTPNFFLTGGVKLVWLGDLQFLNNHLDWQAIPVNLEIPLAKPSAGLCPLASRFVQCDGTATKASGLEILS
ncbi:MAG: hypothetical protein KJS91_15325, partial [Planctomycetes bacterium]|nr:hypothetical protein [Planctomycetota bacterium]